MANTEAVSHNVEKFFKLYFKPYLELISNNDYEIENLKKVSYPEMDFVFVFKFIRAELDHLKNLDQAIIDKELRTLFDGALHTVSALAKFKKGYISAHIIFGNYFSNFNDEIKAINEKFEKTKTEKAMNAMKGEKLTKELTELRENSKDNIEEQKNVNKQLADTLQALQNARDSIEVINIEKKEFEKKYLPVFLDVYKKISDIIVNRLIEQVAIFSFGVDRNIWEKASKSKRINNFFRAIKINDMNIQKYMEYHLNHQTSEDSKGEDDVKFRKKLIDSISKIKAFNAKQKGIG